MRLSSAIEAPIRVPPEKSTTAAVARRSASSWSRPASSRVMRVSRVPKANASTRRRAATDAWRYCIIARAYGVIEPDTSSTSTTGRGLTVGPRQRRSSGSPPWRSEDRSVRRRSGRCARRREARMRRERLVGPRSARRARILLAAASSSSVISAKSLRRSSSTSL